MADDYTSIADGVLLVGVIIGWAYLLDVLAYRWPAATRIIHPGSLVLVRDDRMLRRNMRRELITEDELYSPAPPAGRRAPGRRQGVRMESEGRFGVIPRNADNNLGPGAR